MTSSQIRPRLLPPEFSALCRRVIFLDFDGVLHPLYAVTGARPPLTPQEIKHRWPETFVHLPVLADLLKNYADVAVVVSSSWRIFLSDEEIGELLRPISRWYAGSTGSPYVGRDIAIREWLQFNGIEEFVVLDDVKSFFPGYWPNLILCDSNYGISDFFVQQRLRAWLRRD